VLNITAFYKGHQFGRVYTVWQKHAPAASSADRQRLGLAAEPTEAAAVASIRRSFDRPAAAADVPRRLADEVTEHTVGATARSGYLLAEEPAEKEPSSSVVRLPYQAARTAGDGLCGHLFLENRDP
jgi:hypothetical protein